MSPQQYIVQRLCPRPETIQDAVYLLQEAWKNAWCSALVPVHGDCIRLVLAALKGNDHAQSIREKAEAGS
jgi:hypothetical protein